MLMGKPWWASLWFIWAVACKGVIRVSVSGETDSPTAQQIDNPESEAARLPGPCSDRQSGRYQGSGLSGCCRGPRRLHPPDKVGRTSGCRDTGKCKGIYGDTVRRFGTL